MKKIWCMVLCAFLVLMSGFASKNQHDDNKSKVVLSKINSKVWVHTTYVDYNGVSTPSNGLIVITSRGAVIIDTPWNNVQTQELLKLVKKDFNKRVVLAIITHAHEDRIGGIDTLLKNRIEVESTKLTAALAEKSGYKRPKGVLNYDNLLKIGGTRLEVFYPGEGHTSDNIVVWLPDYKVLFGGCLVKSAQAKDLGNIQEANVKEWRNSINKVIKKFRDLKTVIPGHGNWGDKSLLIHTLELFK